MCDVWKRIQSMFGWQSGGSDMHDRHRDRVSRIEALERAVTIINRKIIGLKAGEKTIMSALTDFADKIKADIEKSNAAIEGIGGDIQRLTAKIEELQNLPNPQPEAQAIYDELSALSSGLVNKLQGLDALNTPPVPPEVTIPVEPENGPVA